MLLSVAVQFGNFIRVRIGVTVHKVQIGALLITAILMNNTEANIIKLK